MTTLQFLGKFTMEIITAQTKAERCQKVGKIDKPNYDILDNAR